LHNWREHALPGALFVSALAVPIFSDSLFWQDAIIILLLWAALASAWNIAGGFAGQLSLGHAAYFGLGAYTSTLMKLYLGTSPWIGMLCGALLVATVSVFIGFASTRLRGPYFALVTIAFATTLQIVASRWYTFTKGNEGVPIPFQPSAENFIFAAKLPWTIIVLGYMLTVYVIAVWITRSRFGFQLAGMRENEEAAQALGIHTRLLKIIAIGLSAFLTAFGGTFYAQYIGFIDPGYMFSFDLSIKFALMCIIGGMATAFGPILGAILITALEMYLRAKLGGGKSGLYLVIYGALLIVVVRFIPEGLVAGVPALARRWRGTRA
jgi:branched-chain amino acid transport system permease protein